jgi:hypothetical protein
LTPRVREVRAGKTTVFTPDLPVSLQLCPRTRRRPESPFVTIPG